MGVSASAARSAKVSSPYRTPAGGITNPAETGMVTRTNTPAGSEAFPFTATVSAGPQPAQNAESGGGVGCVRHQSEGPPPGQGSTVGSESFRGAREKAVKLAFSSVWGEGPRR